MMSFNWVDLVIAVILLYYLLEGWLSGLAYLLASLISFLGSLWLAIKFHAPVGNFFIEKFGIPVAWSNVLGYLTIALLGQMVISEIFNYFVPKIPKKFLNSKANLWLGAIISGINGLILITFFLLVILALPIRGTVKKDIQNSVISKNLIILAEKYGGQVKSELTQLTDKAVKFITIDPNSKEKIALEMPGIPLELSIDKIAEQKMLDLINRERSNAGLKPVTFNKEITNVARAHSMDMFKRHYFAHVNPEGLDGADRLNAAKIPWQVSGENLAYAPDVDIAHQGLMDSPGHRANILKPEFRQVGIGVIDAGFYGQMFTQNFILK